MAALNEAVVAEKAAVKALETKKWEHTKNSEARARAILRRNRSKGEFGIPVAASVVLGRSLQAI
eukprot:3952128-Pleurochrysis_carterae.AAC.1